jgi:MFS family permease
MSSGRALVGNSHYRRLFVARTISNVGNGIFPIALSFGILALPGATPTSLSMVLAAQAIPIVLLLPFGGVIADRVGSAKIIGITDVLMSLVVGVVAILFATGQVTIPLLLILAPITGALVALWYPAFPGLVPDVVQSEEHLQPANAYVSVASNGGLIVGNALGGLLVASFGAGVAIGVDALSFLAAGLLVFSFRQVSKPHDSGESVLGDLKDGWRLVISIRWFVVVILAFSVIVMVLRGAEEVLGPVLALQEYGGASGWAFILACMSVGLLLGAFAASKIHFGRPMFYGMMITLALPLWLVCLAFALPIWIVAFTAFLWGISIEMFQVMWFTTIQTNIPRESIARVSSYDAMGSLMLGPIGLALAGPLVTLVGLQTAFLLAAVVCLVAIVATLFFPAVRNLRAHQPQE